MRFFLIDKITDWQPGLRGEAIKNVALSEDFFDDHFPRRPIMPGVLMLEGMAQLSGLLLEATLKVRFGKDAKAVMIVVERTKFRDFVKPGDQLVYRTEITSINETGGKVAVQALRAGELVVTSGIVFVFQYVEDPELERRRQALLEVWMQAE